jgi:hypothetical protein
VAPKPPTDDELDTLIRARLALLGIDIDQLPLGAAPDPALAQQTAPPLLYPSITFRRNRPTSPPPGRLQPARRTHGGPLDDRGGGCDDHGVSRRHFSTQRQ